MNSFRKIRRKLYRNSAVLRRCWFYISFVRKNGYIPNFRKPKTYNEKINYRKNNPKHELFSSCADKIVAKEWVANQIGDEYIIPNYYVGNSITPEKMAEIIKKHGDCFLKANHNSGPVQLLTENSTQEEIVEACNSVNEQLKQDYGSYSNEPWYSKISPKVLVEKKLPPEKGESDIRDYKFHIFKQRNGTFETVIGVDFDRNNNHSRSFFDENFNYIDLSIEYPSVHVSVPPPDNFSEMLKFAKVLAAPFSYVRVDFYNVGGKIYFGELTFAHESGNGQFSSYESDLWMGGLWQDDPSY